MSNAKCTVCGSLTDYVFDRPCDFCSQPAPVVGMGVTYGCWTDRYAGTVVAVSKSGKTITVQADHAKRVDKNGMGGAQEYAYAPNPNGEKITFRVTSKKGRKAWRSGTHTACVGERNAHYDPHF